MEEMKEVKDSDIKDTPQVPVVLEKVKMSIEYTFDTANLHFDLPTNPLTSRFLLDQLEILVKQQTAQLFTKQEPMIKKANIFTNLKGFLRKK